MVREPSIRLIKTVAGSLRQVAKGLLLVRLSHLIRVMLFKQVIDELALILFPKEKLADTFANYGTKATILACHYFFLARTTQSTLAVP